MVAEIRTKVERCARCGGNHELVTFRLFKEPPPDVTHWGTCPTTGDPILLTLCRPPLEDPGSQQ